MGICEPQIVIIFCERALIFWGAEGADNFEREEMVFGFIGEFIVFFVLAFWWMNDKRSSESSQNHLISAPNFPKMSPK